MEIKPIGDSHLQVTEEHETHKVHYLICLDGKNISTLIEKRDINPDVYLILI